MLGVGWPVIWARRSDRGASKRSNVVDSSGPDRVSSRSHELVSVLEGVNHFVIAGRLLKAFLNTVGSSTLKPVTLLSAHSEHGAGTKRVRDE
jgi:hypothetical protein